MNNKTISVIIPVYNSERYLRKALDSVICQSYEKLEILVVDDGSTDGSPAICDEYAKADDRVKVFHIPNGGISFARNHAIENATGEYIGFMDSDDDIEPGMFETLARLMDEYDADIVGCRYNVLFDDEGPKEEIDRSLPEVEIIPQNEAVRRLLLKEGCSSVLWDKLYKASLFDDIRMIEGMIYEDQEVLLRLFAKAEKPFVQINKRLYTYYHRKNSGSITQSSISEKRHDLLIARKEMHKTVKRYFPESEEIARNRFFEAALQYLYDARILPGHKAIRKDIRNEIRDFAKDNKGLKQRKDIALCMVIMKGCMPLYDLMFTVRSKLKK